MKVIDLLDKIFFEGGDRELLPILKKFAGDEGNEIFGIYDNEISERKRVLIISPESYAGVLKKYALYLGDSNGSNVRVCQILFTKDEVMAIYGSVLGDGNLFKQVTNSDINKAAKELAEHIVKSKEQSKQIYEKEDVKMKSGV